MKWLWRNKWIFFALVAVVGLAVDLVTKELAERNLKVGELVPVIGPYLQFVLVHNTAAVFGLDPRKLIPGLPLNSLFYVFNTIAMIILVLYYKNLRVQDTLLRWAVALIMPGALGNLVDRLFHAQRGVVDFIRIGLNERIYWFIFNMADVYVTVGVGMILLAMVLEEGRKKKGKIESSASTMD